MTSENGRGTLVIRDAKDTDQGAYTCEAINAKGMVFGIPDGVLSLNEKAGTPSASLKLHSAHPLSALLSLTFRWAFKPARGSSSSDEPRGGRLCFGEFQCVARGVWPCVASCLSQSRASSESPVSLTVCPFCLPSPAPPLQGTAPMENLAWPGTPAASPASVSASPGPARAQTATETKSSCASTERKTSKVTAYPRDDQSQR